MVSLEAERPEDRVLALPDGALDLFPGPLLVFDQNGAMIAAHPESGALAQALQQGQTAEVAGLVQAALGGGHAQAGTVQVETPDGIGVFDLTCLPLASGGAVVLGRDVTLHHNLRAALVESRQRYKDFVEISSDFAWETGPDGSFVFVSPRGALGHAASDLVARDPSELVLEREADEAALPFHTKSPVESQEVWLRTRDGSPACVRVSAKPVYARDGRWMGARGVCRDVTRERERDAQLSRARNRERILNHIVRTFRDEVDPKNMLRVATETVARGIGAASCQIFRVEQQTEGEAVRPAPERPFVLSASHGRCEADAALPILNRVARNDEMVELSLDGYEALAVPTRYHHQVNGCLVLWRSHERGPWGADDRLLAADIADQIGIANEQICAHENIVRISRTDGLTGLFNRRAFFEELSRRFQRLVHQSTSAALMYVDLDNFKMVNDIKGHAAGDAVLCAVRDMLLAHTRPTDLVARLGGDEFAIWLEGADLDAAERKAEMLLALSREELLPQSGAADWPLGFSIGVAVHEPDSVEDMAALIGRADSAMYTIKRGGKGSFAVAPLMARPLPGDES